MNVAEAAELLAAIRMLDNRIGDSDRIRAEMWAEVLEDVSLPAARAALKEHYKTSAETFNPGHVRPLVKKLMGQWKEQKRTDEQRRAQIARAARGELEGSTNAHLSEEERRENARSRQHSPQVAAELAAARAKLAPSKPGALKISGSMDSPRRRWNSEEEEEFRRMSERSQAPQRLGGLLSVVRERVRPEESAA